MTIFIEEPNFLKPNRQLQSDEYFNEKDKEIREAKLPGRWSGRIYVDEIAEPDYEEVNLDTQRSIKGKANIKNVTQSSPLTF